MKTETAERMPIRLRFTYISATALLNSSGSEYDITRKNDIIVHNKAIESKQQLSRISLSAKNSHTSRPRSPPRIFFFWDRLSLAPSEGHQAISKISSASPSTSLSSSSPWTSAPQQCGLNEGNDEISGCRHYDNVRMNFTLLCHSTLSAKLIYIHAYTCVYAWEA